MNDKYLSYDLMGYKLTPLTIEDIIHIASNSVLKGLKTVVASQNLHAMYVYHHNEKFRLLHNLSTTYIHIDGMPLVALSKLFGLPIRRTHRTAVIDWIFPILELASKNEWRVFYLGSTSVVFDKGLEKIKEILPDLQISGHHGYFDMGNESLEAKSIMHLVNSYKPSILLLGMGMGRQESWIYDNNKELNVNFIATIGGCMDLISGEIPLAPRWLGKLGIEWLFLLIKNPKRGFRRYLIEPWLLAILLFNKWTSNYFSVK